MKRLCFIILLSMFLFSCAQTTTTLSVTSYQGIDHEYYDADVQDFETLLSGQTLYRYTISTTITESMDGIDSVIDEASTSVDLDTSSNLFYVQMLNYKGKDVYYEYYEVNSILARRSFFEPYVVTSYAGSYETIPELFGVLSLDLFDLFDCFSSQTLYFDEEDYMIESTVQSVQDISELLMFSRFTDFAYYGNEEDLPIRVTVHFGETMSDTTMLIETLSFTNDGSRSYVVSSTIGFEEITDVRTYDYEWPVYYEALPTDTRLLTELQEVPMTQTVYLYASYGWMAFYLEPGFYEIKRSDFNLEKSRIFDQYGNEFSAFVNPFEITEAGIYYFYLKSLNSDTIACRFELKELLYEDVGDYDHPIPVTDVIEGVNEGFYDYEFYSVNMEQYGIYVFEIEETGVPLEDNFLILYLQNYNMAALYEGNAYIVINREPGDRILRIFGTYTGSYTISVTFIEFPENSSELSEMPTLNSVYGDWFFVGRETDYTVYAKFIVEHTGMYYFELNDLTYSTGSIGILVYDQWGNLVEPKDYRFAFSPGLYYMKMVFFDETKFKLFQIRLTEYDDMNP